MRLRNAAAGAPNLTGALPIRYTRAVNARDFRHFARAAHSGDDGVCRFHGKQL